MRTSERKLFDQIEQDGLDDDVPLARTLRKVIALGGNVGSTKLREWATHELQGYTDVPVAEVPDYRKPPALIALDGRNALHVIRNQQISRFDLPDGVRDHIEERVTLPHGVGELEKMRGTDGVRLGLPSSAEIVKLMNYRGAQAGLDFQTVERVYWMLSQPALEGVLDAIRTTLVSLVAEMRAGTPRDATPTPEVADQAVNVVVKGIGQRVTVHQAQASGVGSHDVQTGGSRETHHHHDGGRSKTFWVILGTLIGLAALFVAVAAWQGWWT